LPQKGTAVAALIARHAHDLTVVINPERHAEKISGKCSEIGHDSFLPKKRMSRAIADQIRGPHYLAPIINGVGDIVYGPS